jgi:hypothetical protein
MYSRASLMSQLQLYQSQLSYSLLLFLHKHHSHHHNIYDEYSPFKPLEYLLLHTHAKCDQKIQDNITMTASDSLQDIAKSLNNQATFHNEDPQLLSEFTSFPKLPLEIRLMIFEYALTNDDRVFNIAIFRDRSKTKQGFPRVGVRLAYAPDRKEEGKENYVALLATCNESRSVALKVFKHTLPAYHGGILRFSDRTIVTLANLERFIFDESIFPGAGRSTRRERIFKKIKSGLLNVKRYGIDCGSENGGGFYIHLHNNFLHDNFSFGICRIVNQVMLKEIVLVEWDKRCRIGAFLQWKTKRELIDVVSNHLQHGPLGTIQKTYLGFRKGDE